MGPGSSSLTRVFRSKSRDLESPDMLFLRGRKKGDANICGKKL